MGEPVVVEGIAAQKAALRAEATRRRMALAREHPTAGRALVAHAERLPAARTVSAYLPIRGEIDPMPLALALRDRGAGLALPTITREGLVFRTYEPGEPLRGGPFGTLEPTGPTVVPDLLLVPLLAFDRTGARLGYGKAYYDRWLAAHRGATAVGVAFSGQEVPRVPSEPHDVRLAWVLTETGAIEGERGCD